MEPLAILAIADGALTIVEKLAPVISDLAKAGQITPETQTALQARIEVLRQHDAFAGPEWET
jgi:hypothetical protein